MAAHWLTRHRLLRIGYWGPALVMVLALAHAPACLAQNEPYAYLATKDRKSVV